MGSEMCIRDSYSKEAHQPIVKIIGLFRYCLVFRRSWSLFLTPTYKLCVRGRSHRTASIRLLQVFFNDSGIVQSSRLSKACYNSDFVLSADDTEIHFSFKDVGKTEYRINEDLESIN